MCSECFILTVMLVKIRGIFVSEEVSEGIGLEVCCLWLWRRMLKIGVGYVEIGVVTLRLPMLFIVSIIQVGQLCQS